MSPVQGKNEWRPAGSGAAASMGEDAPMAKTCEPASDARPKVHALMLGVVLVALSAIGLFEVRTDELLPLGARGSDPGPGFLPELLLWLLLAGGLAQIGAVTAAAWMSGGFGLSNEFMVRCLWMPTLLCLSLVGYYWSIRHFGYLGPSVAFALIWVPLIHFRSGQPFRRRHILQFPIESVILAGALYALFRYGIRVPLP